MCAEIFITFPRLLNQNQSGQMEQAHSSASLTAPLPSLFHLQNPSTPHRQRVRRHHVASRSRFRKRVRLQPSPSAASVSMPPASQLALDPTTGQTGTAETSANEYTESGQSRPRRTTAQSDIEDTILHPGNVRINVQGAFIVDEEPVTPRSDDYEHDPRDIRLPNHTSVVSHIAVDVSEVNCARTMPLERMRRYRTRPPFATPRDPSARAKNVPNPLPSAMLTSNRPDWRIPREARLFLARTQFRLHRRAAQLSEVRDGSHRLVH